jgi:hypothetical protein
LFSQCYLAYFCGIILSKRNQSMAGTITALVFFVVLLAVSFWVGNVLEKNERSYKKIFKED